MTPQERLIQIDKIDAGAPLEGFELVSLTNVYLHCSYAYYELNESLMSDARFDQLCRYLHDNFDMLEMMGVRGVGDVIVKDNLAAGTCLGVFYNPGLREAVSEVVMAKYEI